jgi:signal transduction histidine kinase
MPTMQKKAAGFAARYVAALRTQLKRGPQAGLQSAVKKGRAAVAIGLGTLELARVHEQALAALELSNVKNGFTKLAGVFFAEANAQIVATHRDAQRGKVRLSRLQETLGRRTEELSDANRQLQRGVARRKVAQNAAEKNGRHYKKCLEESLELQSRLRQLTHRVLTAQENERKSLSLELHDEIAQTLLGINIRLLSLKEEARINHKGLKKEIAGTQRLVVKSVNSVKRVARELEDA